MNRELDKWLAENLMCWELKETVDEYHNKFGEWFSGRKYTGFDHYYIHADGEDVTRDLSFLWSPSSKIDQALGDGGPGTVAGAMISKGFEIELHGPTIDTYPFYCEFMEGRGAVAETPAEAICLAAKKALEAK